MDLSQLKFGAVLLLALLHHPGSNAHQLSDLVCMDYHAVCRHLNQLHELGLIHKNSPAWSLTEAGHALFTRYPQPSPPVDNALKARELDPDQRVKSALPTLKNALKARKPHKKTRALSASPRGDLDSPHAVIIINKDSLIKDSLIKESINNNKDETTRKKRALLSTLAEYGVVPNERVYKLLDLSITPDDIHGHAMVLIQAHKTFPVDAGLLIIRLESGIKAPPINPDTHHLAACKCGDCASSALKRSLRDHPEWYG